MNLSSSTAHTAELFYLSLGDNERGTIKSKNYPPYDLVLIKISCLRRHDIEKLKGNPILKLLLIVRCLKYRVLIYYLNGGFIYDYSRFRQANSRTSRKNRT